MNFKQETLEELKEHNLTWNDVEFIQTNDFCIKDKDKFLEQMDFEYDDGYGSEYIPTDLVIVGKDWWLERHTYDGSEWWEFKRLPIKKAKVCNAKFKNVDLGMELVEEGKEEPQPVKKSWCDGCPFLGIDSHYGVTRDVCAVLSRMKGLDFAFLGAEENREKNCPVKDLKNAKN